MIETVLSSAVVSAIIAGVIAIVGNFINSKNAKIAIHDERKYKMTQELYEAFLAEVKLIESTVRGEREREEDRILQNIRADKYDIEDAFGVLDSYYAHVGICKLVHQKMDVIQKALYKTAYLLDDNSHISLKKKYASLSDEIKRTPSLYNLSFDFEEQIDDIEYMYTAAADMNTACDILNRVEELVEETGQSLIETLQKLCR